MLRRRVLSLAAALVSQLWIPGLATAQETPQPPPEAPPAAEPAPAQPEAPAAAPEAPAAAAEAPPAAAPAGRQERTEEIVVTGTRIRRKDLNTPAPVTVISKEQVMASGKVSIGDFLQSLPEQGNAINTQINNGGDGATRVSLRGLGTARTLVLVNGRRMVPGGTGADASVDLNSLPTAAIERIEILKDGGSAIYGSDAIAGVVNIITRRNFAGTEVNALAGASQKGDGNTYDLNIMTGVNSDRGNILFSGGFYRMEPVWAGDRDWSDKPFQYNYRTGRVRVLGSYGVPQGALDLFGAPGDYPSGSTTWNTLRNTYGSGASWTESTFIFDPGAGPGGIDWRPMTAADTYNYQPENYLVTPQQRVSLYSSGDTRLGDVARGFFEASYVNRRSQWKIAPEPLFTDGEGLSISSQNQYNPFGIDITPDLGGVYRRLVEFGNRTEAQDLDTFRIVSGLDGTLPESLGPAAGWFWEANFNYGRTQGVSVKNGNLLLPNLQSAVGPSYNFGTVAAPDWGCVTDPLNPSGTRVANCVPLDLFHGAGSITGDQMRALTFTGAQRGYNQMVGVQVNSTGELFKVRADRPISLGVGYEYRRLSGAFIFDPVTAAGWTTGNKGENTQGSYSVNEGYAELTVPIVSNMEGVQDLEAIAAARVFDYTTFGSDWTYKVGARYKPINDVTVRGTYSTAFRAPSIGDLYSGQYDTFPNASDPCSGVNSATSPPALVAACAAAGIPTDGSFNDTRVQLRGREGGNPNLDPETAKIYTIGLVFEPRWVKNLSVTLDWYSIKVDNSISTLDYNLILNSCYPENTSTTKYCNAVLRDPTSHRIVNIINTATNVGGNEAAGLDVALKYALASPFGRFGFGVDATWLQKFNKIEADGTVIEGKGNYDLNSQGTYGIYPAWKANFGVTWGWKGLGAGVNNRYLSGFKECRSANFTSSAAGSCALYPDQFRNVPPYGLWDAFVSYGLTSGFGKTNLAVGMQNALDTKPPYIYNGFTASTDPSAYDLMGRFMYVRLGHSY